MFSIQFHYLKTVCIRIYILDRQCLTLGQRTCRIQSENEIVLKRLKSSFLLYLVNYFKYVEEEIKTHIYHRNKYPFIHFLHI